MDFYPDVIVTGEETMNYFGKSVSSAGDFNNDGIDDVLIGAWKKNSSSGKVYIYFGTNNITGLNDDAEKSGNIEIYPNPADNYINIQTNSEEYFNVDILDVTGKTLGTTIFYNQLTMDLNKFESGIYFFRIKGAAESIIKKVVVY
jgi:hypothetical protein